MNWMVALKGVLQIAIWVSKQISDEQLRDAGEARLLREQTEQLDARFRKAIESRYRAAEYNAAGGLRDNDGYRRD